MPAKSLYDNIHQLFQDIVAPQIEGLKGEMAALRSEQHRLDDKVDALGKLMEEGLKAVRTEISYTNRRLDKALEIRERLAAH